MASLPNSLQAGLMGSLTAGWFLSHSYRLVAFVPVAFAAALGTFLERRGSLREDWKHYALTPVVTVALLGLIYLIVGMSQ